MIVSKNGIISENIPEFLFGFKGLTIILKTHNCSEIDKKEFEEFNRNSIKSYIFYQNLRFAQLVYKRQPYCIFHIPHHHSAFYSIKSDHNYLEYQFKSNKKVVLTSNSTIKE